MNEIEVVGRTIGGAFVAIDPTEHDRQVYEDIKTQFDQEINKKHREIQKLFDVESSLLKLYPLPFLRQTTVLLRQRFALVAGGETYKQYSDTGPPDIKTANRDDLLADSQVVLKQVHDIYLFKSAREIVLRKLKVTLIGVTFVAVVTSLYLVLAHVWTVSIILLIIDFGMIGALMSVFQRLQTTMEAQTEQDPMLELIGLKYGRVGIWFSLIIGSVFAVLLYIVFLSGILGQGGIFPELVYPDAPKNGVSLGDLFNGKLANPEAYAKALVYSFIAGFAERFVPNILARIVQRSTNEKP
jgi:hypothetical protein